MTENPKCERRHSKQSEPVALRVCGFHIEGASRGLPGLALQCRHTAPAGASWVAQGERYAANPGAGVVSNSLVVPDATGRGRLRGPVWIRTTRTGERARRSLPYSHDGVPSASGVRHEEGVKRALSPGLASTLALGYPRRPCRGCVPVLRREAVEASCCAFSVETTLLQRDSLRLFQISRFGFRISDAPIRGLIS